MKNPYDIIKRPVLTEKAYEGIEEKRYVFEVDIKANKAEIKNAIETVFRATANLPEAKISYVNTLNVYDILNAGKVVLTKAAKESVEEVYA